MRVMLARSFATTLAAVTWLATLTAHAQPEDGETPDTSPAADTLPSDAPAAGDDTEPTPPESVDASPTEPPTTTPTTTTPTTTTPTAATPTAAPAEADSAIPPAATTPASEGDVPAVPADSSAAVPPERDLLFNRYTSLGIATGAYTALNVWTYFAWYRKRATADHIIWRNEGWFGPDTYSAGSDKLGHMWACYVMNRLTASLLAEGGWEPLPSALLGTAGSMGFFTFIEIKDGYHPHYGFSWADMLFNTAGNLLALGMITVPELDEMFDFKVDYLPSKLYFNRLKEHGAVNAGEDYTGQTFMLAYHLGSLSAVRKSHDYQFLRFVDLSVGYGSRNYLPEPTDPDTHRLQDLRFGIGLDVQHVLDVAWGQDHAPRSRGHDSLRFITDIFAVPYTTVPALTLRRDNGPAPPEDPAP